MIQLPPTIRDLAHVTRYLENREPVQQFYQEILDLRIKSEAQHEVILTDGHVDIQLCSQVAVKKSSLINVQNSHVAFSGISVKEMCQELERKGIKYRHRVVDEWLSQVFFQDPAANLLEVLEDLRQPQPNFSSLKVDHLTHVTKDLERDTAKFLALGLRMIPRPDFGVGGAWFTDGKIDYHLVLPNAQSEKRCDPWEFNLIDGGSLRIKS